MTGNNNENWLGFGLWSQKTQFQSTELQRIAYLHTSVPEANVKLRNEEFMSMDSNHSDTTPVLEGRFR